VRFYCERAVGPMRMHITVSRENRGEGMTTGRAVGSGVGIEEEQLAKIWGAFNQGSAGMARKYGGECPRSLLWIALTTTPL
jgi:hypothetical protein